MGSRRKNVRVILDSNIEFWCVFSRYFDPEVFKCICIGLWALVRALESEQGL